MRYFFYLIFRRDHHLKLILAVQLMEEVLASGDWGANLPHYYTNFEVDNLDKCEYTLCLPIWTLDSSF